MKPRLLDSIISTGFNRKETIPKFDESRKLVSSNILYSDLYNLLYNEDNIRDHVSNTDIHLSEEERAHLPHIIDHISDNIIHITKEERNSWNAKQDSSVSLSMYNAINNKIDSHAANGNLHVSEEEQNKWNSAVSQISEIKSLVSSFKDGISWKSPVDTHEELLTTYPEPKAGWSVYVKDEGFTYTFSESDGWVPTSSNSINPASSDADGLLTKELFIKLSNIEEEANKYIHPNNENIRHVTDEQVSLWTNKANDKAVDKTYRGLMTPEMYVQLTTLYDKYTNNQLYELPDLYAKMIVTDSTHRFVTEADKANWNNKAERTLASSLTNGLMSATLFTKLEGIEEGANNYSHPLTHPATIIETDSDHRFVSDQDIENWNYAFQIIQSISEVSLQSETDIQDDNIMPLGTSPMNEAMSIGQEEKLNLLYNKYTQNRLYSHPLVHPATMIETDSDHRFVRDNDILSWNNKADNILADEKHNGLMSIEMFKKLKNSADKSDIPKIPESLPANGGDANTVGGYSINDILAENKRASIVIGNISYDSEANSDLLYEDNNLKELLITAIDKLPNGGEIIFRPGNYILNEKIEINPSNISFRGVGDVNIISTINNNEETISSVVWDFSSDEFVKFTSNKMSQGGITINGLQFNNTATGLMKMQMPITIDDVELYAYIGLNPRISGTNSNIISLHAVAGQILKIYVSSAMGGYTMKIDNDEESVSKTVKTEAGCIELEIVKEGIYTIYPDDSYVQIYRIDLVGTEPTTEFENTINSINISGNKNQITNITFNSSTVSIKITGSNNTVSSCQFNGMGGIDIEGYNNVVKDCKFFTNGIGIKLESDIYNTTKNILSDNYFSGTTVPIYISKCSKFGITKNYIRNNIIYDATVGIKLFNGSQYIIGNTIDLLNKNDADNISISIEEYSMNNIISNNILDKDIVNANNSKNSISCNSIYDA